jgi:cardiolipin synthase (CMP-forming)
MSNVLNLPNLLSISRILLVPLIISLLIAGEMRWALFLLAVAGSTDALDGWLAKRFGWQTELGAYIDPLADKLLLIGVFVTLGAIGLLPAWLVILVVARDIMIMAAILLSSLLNQPVPIQPHRISKLNTAAQIVLAVTIVAGKAMAWSIDGLANALIIAVTVLTIASTVDYLLTWIKHMSSEASKRGDRS